MGLKAKFSTEVIFGQVQNYLHQTKPNPFGSEPNLFWTKRRTRHLCTKNNHLTFGSSSAASISLASRFFSSLSDDMITATNRVRSLLFNFVNYLGSYFLAQITKVGIKFSSRV